MQTPSDPDRARQYGEVATLPGVVAAGLDGIFKAANAPEPHEVAVAITKLIDTSPGRRPHRIIVGGAFGADLANAAIEPLQQQMVAGFGLERLSMLKHG
jgi:hypothetical protein